MLTLFEFSVLCFFSCFYFFNILAFHSSSTDNSWRDAAGCVWKYLKEYGVERPAFLTYFFIFCCQGIDVFKVIGVKFRLCSCQNFFSPKTSGEEFSARFRGFASSWTRVQIVRTTKLHSLRIILHAAGTLKKFLYLDPRIWPDKAAMWFNDTFGHS